MGRKNHWWGGGTRDAEGVLISTCKNCGMQQRDDFFEINGKVYSVLQWSAPDGRLLAVRPVVDITAPRTAPSFKARFGDDVNVAGSPQCPKDPAAWASA